MSKSAMRHMGMSARLALKKDHESHLNLHAYRGTTVKVYETIHAAVELAPEQDLIAATIKAHQCETCWEELHTDQLIYRFETLRNAKRGKADRKAHIASHRQGQMLMDWHEEEMQAEAWLEIAIWDCIAENSLFL
jgi:hypothetical protein